jgi:ribosome-associated protein
LLAKKLVLLAKEASLDKKSEEPIILDLQKFNTVARYFLIVHGNSYPHVKAIAEHIMETAEAKGAKVYHVEGMDEGLWVLVDFGSVIAHVFYRTTREFYGLERLWGDAPTL